MHHGVKVILSNAVHIINTYAESFTSELDGQALVHAVLCTCYAGWMPT